MLVVLFAVGLNAVLAPGPSDVPFRRYVSPVLPDGARYTFLYPSDMTPRAVPLTAYVSKRGPYVRLRPPWWGDREVILVSYTLRPAGSAPPAASGRLTRSDLSPTVGNRDREHVVLLTDARGNSRCQLTHICIAAESARFKALDPAIADSLQVLPPGAPIPKP